MKKRILLSVFAALTLGACMIFAVACSGNGGGSGASSSGSGTSSSGSGTSSSGSASSGGDVTANGQVTEVEWNQSWLQSGVDNFTMEQQTNVAEGSEQKILTAMDGNKVYQKFDIQGMVGESYYDMETGACYNRSPDGWTVTTIDPDSMTFNAFAELFAYEDFEYDAEKECYVNKEAITVNVGLEQIYETVEISFEENGNIHLNVSAKVQAQSGLDQYLDVTTQCEITKIGTTSVVLPVVGGAA